MASTPEKKIKEKVVKVLKEYGAYYFYPVASGFASAGIPDIICCYRGVFIGIEVKYDADKNPPTALQMKNLDAIKANEGVAMVVDHKNVEAVRVLLNGIDTHLNKKGIEK